MKKLFFIGVFALLSLWSVAQGSKDYLTKKSDGKVYWMRGGKPIQIAIDVPLKNGSAVNYRGDIKDKDGTVTQQLQTGDKVMMDGTFVKAGKKSKG